VAAATASSASGTAFIRRNERWRCRSAGLSELGGVGVTGTEGGSIVGALTGATVVRKWAPLTERAQSAVRPTGRRPKKGLAADGAVLGIG
jgi:hypothetical protein